MKMSKLVMLLLLASPLVACQQVDEPVKPDVTCTNYDGRFACYMQTYERSQAYRVAYQMIDMGYQDFIIQFDSGYIEFENGEFYDEVINCD